MNKVPVLFIDNMPNNVINLAVADDQRKNNYFNVQTGGRLFPELKLFFENNRVNRVVCNLGGQYNSDISNTTFLPLIKDIVNLSDRAGVPVVLTGYNYSLFPEQSIDYFHAKYAIAGNSHTAFRHASLTDIKELTYSEDHSESHSCAVIPWQYSFTDVYHQKFSNTLVLSNLMISAGNGTHYEPDVKSVFDMLESAYTNTRPAYVYIFDEFLKGGSADPKIFLEEYVRRGFKAQLCATIDPRKNGYDAEFFQLYAKASGVFLTILIGDFSNESDISYRSGSIDDIIKCCKLIEKNKIPYTINCSLSGFSTTKETIDEIINSVPYLEFSDFRYHFGTRIFPGTELYRHALREGSISRFTNLLFPKFYISAELNQADVKDRLDKLLRKHKSAKSPLKKSAKQPFFKALF
ncbi:MAG: hypothetical protein WAT19_04005 [Ferruginibacter sp.]